MMQQIMGDAKDTGHDRFEFEREAYASGGVRVAGIDEAGRGPLAGPVVAAAVVLPREWAESGLPPELSRLNDSKQVSEKQRERLFEFISAHEAIDSGVAVLDAAIIDEINILRATHRAMNEALAALSFPPDHALVDGLRVDSLSLPQTAIVKGDSRSFSIAAASILAKVTRDRLMMEYDAQYPAYGFARHKGYGTKQHLAALAESGPCALHRRSFAPVRAQQLKLI